MKFTVPLLLSVSPLALSAPNLATPTPSFHIRTPLLIETPMTSGCDSFYLVKADDTCSKIASLKGISLS
jgi:hypothetical protein